MDFCESIELHAFLSCAPPTSGGIQSGRPLVIDSSQAAYASESAIQFKDVLTTWQTIGVHIRFFTGQ